MHNSWLRWLLKNGNYLLFINETIIVISHEVVKKAIRPFSTTASDRAECLAGPRGCPGCRVKNQSVVVWMRLATHYFCKMRKGKIKHKIN
jgi:hypothetical protein